MSRKEFNQWPKRIRMKDSLAASKPSCMFPASPPSIPPAGSGGKKKKKWWPTPSSASYRPFGTRVHVINIIKMKNGQVVGVRLVPWGIRKQLYIQLLLLDGLHHTLRDKASCWAWQPCMHAPQWKWEHAQHLLGLGHVWRPVLLPSYQAPSCLVLAWLCLGQEVAALRPNSHWEPNGNPDALASSLLEWSHSCEKKRRQCSFLLHLVE